MLCSLKLIQPAAYDHNGMNLDSSYGCDALVQELASGAILLGLRAPAWGLATADVRGLQAWVAEDSTNIGRLICVAPTRGLPRVLLDLNKGLDCPEVDRKHLKK